MSKRSKLEPFHGSTISLQNLCIEITDCHHSTPKWTESGKLVIRNFNIKKGSLDLSNASYTDPDTFNERIRRSVPEPGDLIITREAPMGEVCIIPEGVECCLGQRLVLIKPNHSKVSSEYLLYALQSEFVQKQIQKSDRTGSIVSNLRIPVLKELPIPQFGKIIEDNLSKILFSIDSKIELNNRINQELEAMAKLIYDYWFVQFDFPISKEQAAKMGNPSLEGKPYKSSGGPMTYNDQLKREIPEGWEDGSFEDIGEIIGGSTPSKSIKENFSIKNGTPWITPNDLSNNTGNKYISRGEKDVTKRGIKEASLKLMPPGTILLTSRAPIGYTAVAREFTTTNQGFKSIVPSKGYSTEFVYYTVRLYIQVMIQYASGSTFKEISGGTLKTIKLPVPPKELVQSFTEKVSPIFRRQDLLEQENQKLAELRDWLLPMLMNGQVTIKDAEKTIHQAQENISIAAEERGEYG